MKSTKCAECGFVGWADLENCKACGAPLGQHSHNLPRATSLPMTDYVQWDEAEPPKQGLAICALVLGNLSCASCGVFAITSLPGTIISWIAMQRAKREPWRYGGQGLGFKNGYIFSLELTTDDENQEGYAITAVPMNYGTSGARSFYIDETQVMRAADNRGGPASKLDEPVDPGYDYRSTERPRRADYRPQTVY